ncbi:efflux RND transporter periplasmic adaptor subunit [Roseivivax sp. CAU 1753]
MKRLTPRRLGLFAVALLAAFGGYMFLTERPVSVTVVTAERDVPVRVYGLGTVEARIVSRIGFEVGAALVELTADSGDSVARGQVLARLHPAEQDARVARAEAAVAAAEASLGRATATVTRAEAVLAQRQATNVRQQELAQRRTISVQTAEESQRDVDVAAADLAVAQSEIGVARAQKADADAALRLETALRDHHELRAPFDAVVVDRHAEVGTVVQAGAQIFTLMDPATVWTLAYVDEARAGDIFVGQTAEVTMRSLPQEVFGGTVARIGIESDRVNEERRVWVACDRCPPRIFLGEQAEVRITVATLAEALLVPEIAVTGFDGHKGRIRVVQDGRLAEVPVTFGHRTEDARLEVVNGLPEGARIVAVPLGAGAVGARARIVDRGAP